MPDVADNGVEPGMTGAGSNPREPIQVLQTAQAAAVSTGESRFAISTDVATCKPLWCMAQRRLASIDADTGG